MSEHVGTPAEDAARPDVPCWQHWRHGEHEARAIQRPDNQWMIRLPADSGSWPDLIANRPRAVDRLVTKVSGHAPDQVRALRAAGFTTTRSEQVWRIPLANLPDSPATSATHRLVPVTECDLERVTALDNTIRHDIPGTAEWSGTVSDLQDSLDDEEFDPKLYLIAEHTRSGDYHGLIRVWFRRPRPRLGCLGAVASWRRTRLVPLLLAAATRELRDRGINEVVTETDIANRAVMLLAGNHGALPVEQVTEWTLTP